MYALLAYIGYLTERQKHQLQPVAKAFYSYTACPTEMFTCNHGLIRRRRQRA